MKRSFARDGGAREASVEPSVSLKAVLHNPRESLFPSFASLFEESPAGGARNHHVDVSAGRAIALDDFRSMTSPEMGRLMARFAANHADGGDGDGAADAAEADALAAQLATVPAGFFETDFALRDASPAFGHAGDAPDGAARAAHGEELGGYLDVVEGQLVGQLGRSSDEFFRALGNFQELWARVRETCGEVKDLRTRIRDMQCEAVQGTMRVPRLACKQSNLVALQSKVRLMRDVVRASEKARELMLAEDFPETCRVIAAARKTLDGELKGVECLRHTAHHLAQFQELAVSYMGNEWSAYAVASSWEARDAPPAPPGLAGPDLLLAKAAGRRAARVGALQPLVRGLVANGKMGTVLAKYAQRCDDDFKETARTAVAECARSASPPAGENGGDRAALDAAAFRSCLEICLEHLLGDVLAAVALHNGLRAMVDAGAADGRGLDPEQRLVNDAGSLRDPPEAGDHADLFKANHAAARAVCDAALKRVGKLLHLRRDAHAKVPLPELKHVWDAALDFAVCVERCSGSTAFALRSALLGQARAFLEHTHTRHKTDLALALDSEKWSQVDVAPDRQRAFDRLAAGKLFLDGGDDDDVAAAPEPPPAVAGGKKRDLNTAVVEGRRYKVVWSTLVLLQMAFDELRVAASFPVLATDVLERVVDLLRFFESRTKQLVLFAGAIHSSARLRTITAKHLGLASQCLGLVVALLPHATAALHRLLPEKHRGLLAELDKIAADYLDHHKKILSKFVSIMHEMIDAAAPSLEKADYDAAAGPPPAAPFVGDVARNLGALHGVLAKQLPPDQLQEVCSNIFELLNKKLPAVFANVRPKTDDGRTRAVDDLRFLVGAVAKLPGVSSDNLRLDAFIAEHFYGTGG